MAFVALKHLRFGDRIVPPGDPVPVEDGRDYASMLQTGEIQFIPDAPTAAPKHKAKAAPKHTDE